MKLLTICGSLRKESSNRAMLEAFAELAPPDASIEHYRKLASLPHFNPDLDRDPIPPEVAELRESTRQADALVLSTPEYVHALPGSFKNALDWLVSDPTFPGKPVAILHVGERSKWALASLEEVLATMSAFLVKDACARLTLTTNRTRKTDILADPQLRSALSTSVRNLLKTIEQSSLQQERAP